MTKQGYTHIIVPRQLHETLKQTAQREGRSIAKLIEDLLSNINTDINTTIDNPSLHQSENKLKNSPVSLNTFSVNAFPKSVEGRCGDLSPTSRLHRPIRYQAPRNFAKFLYVTAATFLEVDS